VCQFEAIGSEISQILKQFQNSKSLRILELFQDLRYSTSKCLKLACKVKQLFSPRNYTDPHSGREKLIHFPCQLEALGSGISQIQTQFQNPKSLRILELFSDSRYSTSKCFKLACKVNQLFSSRHYTDPHSGRKKSIHFACQFEALRSGQVLWGSVCGRKGRELKGLFWPAATRNTQKHLQIRVNAPTFW
jgi:hypothetical protein